MEKAENHKLPHDEQETEHAELKGTFVSVMLLGLFIIVSWSGVWWLFLSR